jgi:hypothetical protein
MQLVNILFYIYYLFIYEVYPESKYCLAIKNVLGVKKFYSLLSNSTYLSLHFDISVTHIEVLVVTGHKVLYAVFVEVGCLGREPFFNAFLQLDVAVKLLTGKKSLQVQEQI